MKYLKTYKLFERITIDNKKAILNLLSASSDSGWFGSNMKETFQCFRFDNQWFDTFIAESGSDAESLINKINDNSVSLWEDNLEETFDCVIQEDVYDEDKKIEYNGWYEDLVEYLSIKISDKKEHIVEFIKKEIVNMDLIYDIKDMSLDFIDKNFRLKITAYVSMDIGGKIKNVNFTDIDFDSKSNDIESCFDLSVDIMSMFATNIDEIEDALTGQFKLHPYKFKGIGYKILILDESDKFKWYNITEEQILEEETNEIIRRIKTAYPDEKISEITQWRN